MNGASQQRSLCLGILVQILPLLVACTDPIDPVAERLSESDNQSCFDCHGDQQNTNSAPPPVSWDTENARDTHQNHLRSSSWHQTVACSACHVVPTIVREPGHIDSDLPAELVWQGVAVADNASPSWDVVEATCGDVYCHGSTLADSTDVLLGWYRRGDGLAECGTCHGLPPRAPHPARSDCESCHGEVAGVDLVIISPERHIDGVLDTSPRDCSTCHGDQDSMAPPVDTRGNTLTSASGVGAHRTHLGPSARHAEVQCTECHLVPTSEDDLGHIDSVLPAELAWGELATSGRADPSYDGASCSQVYCHGGAFDDSAAENVSPLWTIVDGSQASCGTCHGLPPANHDPSQPICADCHAAVINPEGDIVTAEFHINGLVEVDLTCTSCHGSDGNPAPPVDTDGNVDTDNPGVGAHRQHLADSDWRAEISCAQCHIVPDDVDDPDHIDSNLPAELTWGDLATGAGRTEPEYNSLTQSCSATYCHGAAIAAGGGSNNEPVWTLVGDGEAACGTCHGLPPRGSHPDNAACSVCHSSVIDAALTIIDRDLHVNGATDF